MLQAKLNHVSKGVPNVATKYQEFCKFMNSHIHVYNFPLQTDQYDVALIGFNNRKNNSFKYF